MPHTPEPWTVNHFVEEDGSVNIHDAGLYEIEEANRQINDMDREDRRKVAEANARLIGASSRLLSACKAIDDFLGRLDWTQISLTVRRTVHMEAIGICQQLTDAIAAAETK